LLSIELEEKKFFVFKIVFRYIFVLQHFSMMFNKINIDTKNIAIIIIAIIVIIIPETIGGGNFI
jgi:high-affinity K+ transport system ATPase subunit B